MQYPLCEHKMNPRACPECFHKPKPVEKKPEQAQEHIRPGISPGYVMPLGEATMRATLGKNARPNFVTAEAGKSMKEPYSSAKAMPPEAFGGSKVWEPPEHDQVIEKQPMHPHADQSVILKSS